jgi:hypothetical protein
MKLKEQTSEKFNRIYVLYLFNIFFINSDFLARYSSGDKFSELIFSLLYVLFET